jgi:hypothetical protein
MKHIKLFEKFHNEYYHQIDFDEWREYMKKAMPVSKNVVKEIDNFFREKWGITETGEYQSKLGGVSCYVQWKSSDKEERIEGVVISEIPDEYFLVTLHKRIVPDQVYLTQFKYKCDQSEGLLKCLEDIIDKPISELCK